MLKTGDHVMILCTVTDSDRDGYTMAINATTYRGGAKVTELTEVGILVRNEHR